MAIKLRDLVARLRIVLDKTAQKQAETEITGGFDKMKGAALKLGAVLAAAFTVRKLFDFAKASVRAAAESEAIWNRLRGSVERTGVAFEDVERTLQVAAKALKETSTVGDEEFAETLDRLIGLTGDFTTSLRAVPLVADVAARFFRGDMAQAADVVGRALTGQTRALRQLGITTTDAAEGLRILAERSKGAAQQELATLAGAAKTIGRNFGDLKEEIGGIISTILRLPAVLGGIARAIDWLTERLKRLRETRQETEARLQAEAAGVAGGPLLPVSGPRTPEEAQADREKEINALKRAADLNLLNNQRLLRALELRREINAELATGIKDVEREVRLTEQRNSLSETIATRARLGGSFPSLEFVTGESITRGSGSLRRPASRITSPGGLDPEVVKMFRSGFSEIEEAGTNAAFGIARGFQDMFELLIQDFGNVGAAAEALARGIGGALLGGLAQFFSSKIAENIAAAAEEVAKGLAASANPLMAWSAPIHFSAAAKHAGAAALWAVAAGGAGAAQGAVAGGGRGGFSGGIPGGARDASARTFDAIQGQPQTIIYIDGFDPGNPVHVRLLGQGIREAQKTDSRVSVRPRSAAP